MKRKTSNPLIVSGLRRQRVDLGLSLLEFADLIGVSEGYLSRLERGERPVPLLLKVRIARLLDARVADLFPVQPAKVED